MNNKPRNQMFRKKSKTSGTDVNNVSVTETLNEESLRALFADSSDVIITDFPTKQDGGISTLLLHSDGMINSTVMTQHVLPNLEWMLETFLNWEELTHELDKSMRWKRIKQHSDVEKLLFIGHLITFFPEQKCCYSIDIAQLPKRMPNESNTEVAIKGARDGFTEDLNTNIALIRKRLRTASLHNEQFIIGERSQTRVSLLYISDIARPEVIEEAKKRLNNLKVDALISSGQLEEGIADSTLSIFPLFDYIGRPDFCSEVLLLGRFVILVDGSPMALIAPCNLLALLKSPEDTYFPYHIIILERLLRLLGLSIAIFLPGFWIALTAYNMDQLPFPLLATVANSRYGLPFSTPVEIILMLGMFELFREAGIRLPKAVGQTIAVLGGLIIGDAAIRAGLTSPTMLVVSATTAVATFTLVNQTLSGTVSIIRLYILLCSSIFGMLGFFIGMMSILAYLSVLESFGLPYLAPYSPLTLRDLMSAFLSKPWAFKKKRPEMLNTIDNTSQEGETG
ncbi:MAG: spore germination protein [Bacillota bacterium]